MKQLKELNDNIIIDMINSIFNIESKYDFDNETIEKYENRFKDLVYEALEYVVDTYDFEDEDEREDLYDSISVNYNADNLVYYFKELELKNDILNLFK